MTMSKRFVLGTWVMSSVALVAFFALVPRLETDLVAQESNGMTVEVTQYTPALHKGTHKYWRVAFRYSCPGRSSVVLKGLGSVAAKGQLTFLTEERELTFLDSRGNILESVSLRVTGIPEGTGLDLPSSVDFPRAYNQYHRDEALTLDECNSVLNSFFTGGYLADPQKDVIYYITSFQNLDRGVPRNKRAQIALQISTPRPDKRSTAFRVQLLVRERGRASESWSGEVSEETREAAASFRDQVASSLWKVHGW